MNQANLGKKVIFLDRDGTINIDSGYVHRAEDWRFIDKSLDGLKLLREAGYVLTVVTNQSGIGEGLYSLEDMEKVHEHMLAEFKKHGIKVEYIAFCPHGRQGGCKCRKPGIGMVQEIDKVIGPIDYENSWTIGDKLLDFELGMNALTKIALIKSRYWSEDDLLSYDKQPELIVGSLYEAAERIIDKDKFDK